MLIQSLFSSSGKSHLRFPECKSIKSRVKWLLFAFVLFMIYRPSGNQTSAAEKLTEVSLSVALSILFTERIHQYIHF